MTISMKSEPVDIAERSESRSFRPPMVYVYEETSWEYKRVTRKLDAAGPLMEADLDSEQKAGSWWVSLAIRTGWTSTSSGLGELAEQRRHALTGSNAAGNSQGARPRPSSRESRSTMRSTWLPVQ